MFIAKNKSRNKIISFDYVESNSCFCYKINGEIFRVTSVDFYFNCKICDKEVKTEGNPKRGVCKYFDMFLCKTCKNSLIHRCEDYRKKYKKSMKLAFGVEVLTPMKVKSIREKAANTMIERYGVPYSGLSPELLKKSWAKWDAKGVASEKEKQFAEEIKIIFNDFEFFDSKNPYIVELNQKTFIPDIAIPELKLFIEFYGDYWHGNPALFSEQQLVSQGRFSRKEINEKDAKRIEAIKKTTGFEVLVIWENEWKKQHSYIIEKIKGVKDERIAFLFKS